MSSITIVFTDNSDGTVSATSTAGAPFTKVTTQSASHVTDVAMGWIKQAIPALLQ